MVRKLMSDVPLEERVGYAIKRAFQAQRAALDHALRDLNITVPQWAVLVCLDYYGDASNAELARLNACTPQTMNEIVRHLEADGLIERQPHPDHGILLPARLTPAGENLLAACMERVSAVEARMLAPLTVEEQKLVRDALNRCVQALQEEPAPV
jgi:DNA-binding MarR family transcriptional regulator